MKKLLISFLVLFPVFIFAQEKLTEESARAELEKLRGELEKVQADLQACETELQKTREQISALDEKASSLQQEIQPLRDELAKYPFEYTVKRGDFLAKIAGYKYIYGTYKAWPRIWRANRDKIKDPDLIYPNWVLKIPHGYDRTYTVIKGDYLWKIANFWWIYRSGRKWKDIYNANKDKIKNPDLIYPGQVFTIPR